ncbi:MAG: hypothetical protein PVG82_02525 [Chromatiales bacterium]
MNEGFVDLRTSAEAARGSDNFWPSFTDIMMVVVMIFLITSVVVVLRNWELVTELRASIEAEQRAAEIARSATQTSQTLEEQLAYAEQEIAVLRMMLMQSTEKNERQNRLLAEREQRLALLEGEVSELGGRLESTERRAAELETDLADSRTRYAQLEESFTAQEARLRSTRDELAELEERYNRQSAELSQLERAGASATRELGELRGEYESLKAKYDKLVRPARTPKGKHLVEVRYEKRGGGYRIGLKQPGETGYTSLSRQQMDQRLAALKREHANRLYVKIIIPADSGLSYTEAWKFTKHVLESYDYYYQ